MARSELISERKDPEALNAAEEARDAITPEQSAGRSGASQRTERHDDVATPMPDDRPLSRKEQRQARRDAYAERQEERFEAYEEQSHDKRQRRAEAREERAAERRERRERRSETKKRLKQAALNKTPKRLKNPSDVQVRFRTGFVYIALTVLSIFLGNLTTVIMLMIVAGICAGEFYYMLRSDAKLPNEVVGIIAAVLYPPSLYFYGIYGVFVVTLGLVLALIVWYVFFLRARIQDVGVSLFGALYTGLLLCGIVVLRCSLDYFWGGVLTLLLFLSVWGNDVFAYLVGRRIGKHRLAPRVSPKKSWEGLFAGLVCSMFFWVIMSFVPGVNMGIIEALFFGIICGLMEVLGDLAESRIKRNSGVKDSGTIMPGHGGLLDRCDSLFLASATAGILMVWFNCLPVTIF